jgi:hypothetical protein
MKKIYEIKLVLILMKHDLLLFVSFGIEKQLQSSASKKMVQKKRKHPTYSCQFSSN